MNPWLTSLKMGTDIALGVAAIYQELIFLRSSDCPQPEDDADAPEDGGVRVQKHDGCFRFTDADPDDEDSESWIETDRVYHLPRSN